MTTETHGIRFFYQSGMLFIQLPSGRQLSYVKPRMGENRFGGEAVTYEGVGGTKKWERIESYDPSLWRILCRQSAVTFLPMLCTLSHCFICGHVHDYSIECSMGVSLDMPFEQMGRTPPLDFRAIVTGRWSANAAFIKKIKNMGSIDSDFAPRRGYIVSSAYKT